MERHGAEEYTSLMVPHLFDRTLEPPAAASGYAG